MALQELIILLPCHSLEDFPQHHEGDEAAGLLANWTALWHPALIAEADAAPIWYRVDDPPEQVSERLIVVPSVSKSDLPTGFAQRAKSDGAVLVRYKADRASVLSEALRGLEGDPPEISEDLVNDFFALGYCYLQIQILTRQMRYSSNLDEVHFNGQLIEGAKAAAMGDEAVAREKLAACFDLLAEERDHYYAVDAFLVDLTLVNEQQFGDALKQELSCPVRVNLLFCMGLLAGLADADSETVAMITEALANGQIGIVGGEEQEIRVSVLPLETVLGNLRRGMDECARYLGRRPEVFGRLRFGLSPVLPQILDKLGFRGAIHATLDDGRFPQGSQIKTRWEGNDGSAIDSLAKVPLDAFKPETFLSLASKLGESMDMDHVATICLAHWPRHTSPAYEDLRRCAKYGAALGKFVTVDEYFRETHTPGHLDRFDPSNYRSPYLKQDVIRRVRDPLSKVADFWRRRFACDTIRAFDTLTGLITGDSVESAAVQLTTEVDTHSEVDTPQDLDERLSSAVDRAGRRLAAQMPRQAGEKRQGYMILNPCSFVRRIGVDVSQLERLPDTGKPIYATGASAGAKHAVVDVPPMGFVWITAGQRRSPTRKPAPLLAEDRSARDGVFAIRNEYFEALVDATTGALKSVKDYNARGIRIAQQLAMRTPAVNSQSRSASFDADESGEYTVMAADRVEVTAASAAFGEIVVRGRMLDRRGQSHGAFVQTFRVWRGNRVIQLDIELDPSGELTSDPWNSYYACRFAWGDETAELFRGVEQTRQVAGNKRISAPQYFEACSGDTRTAILTGGLPYHRRIGFRRLDTLLIVRGETRRRFRLGIGVDLANPMQEATALLYPDTTMALSESPPSGPSSGWLFHVDSKNILATSWDTLVDEGRVAGFRVRLLETAGRTAQASLSTFRAVESASRVNFLGEPLGECPVVDGKVKIDFTAREWVQVEVMFAPSASP